MKKLERGRKLRNRGKVRTSKKIIESAISVNGRGAGFLAIPGFAKDIEIRPGNLNAALNKDRVLVELLSKNGRPEARIVKVLKRNKIIFVGTVKKNGNFTFVKPDDGRVYVDFFVAPENLKNAENEEKVLIKMKEWTNPARNPEGAVLEVIGRKGENDTEMRAIVLSRGLETGFPAEVEKEAEIIRERHLKSPDISGRRDFRDRTTFTIDPEDAKDFDDALSLKKLENGNYEIGVHIADVSHFVKERTKMDREARKRGFSVYLVDRTIPMLPEILSNDLCSLNQNGDKLAFSAVFEMTAEGKIKKRWFGKTIIRSKKRFSYEEAQEILDRKSGSCFWELDILNRIGAILRKTKFDKGAIAFEAEEVRFRLDSSGKPLAVFKKERLDTHKLVEDFMLLANKEVAEFVYQRIKKAGGKGIFIYRIHDLPDAEKMEELSLFLRALGHDFNLGDKPVSPKDINLVLKKIEGRDEEELVRTATIRSMAKAVYSVRNKGHFGLAFKYYTHFTSPIRRYPDLLAHRLLEKVLRGRPVGRREFGLYETMALEASEKELLAASAERESVKYKQAEYMLGKIGNVYEGVVSGVTDWGVYVEELETKSEGMVKLSSLSDDYYVLDGKNYRLVGRSSGRRISLGDRVRFRVIGANPENRTIDYKFV